MRARRNRSSNRYLNMSQPESVPVSTGDRPKATTRVLAQVIEAQLAGTGPRCGGLCGPAAKGLPGCQPR